MIVDPEVRISGRLRETLEDLRAISDDRVLCELMDAGQEHASFHRLVDTGVRGLERYLTEDRAQVQEPEATAERVGKAARKPLPAGNGGRKKEGLRRDTDQGLELAERALAVLDATLSCAAQCPDYQSSLAVQEGLAHIRGRIHLAVENLRGRDHRGSLEKLAESLCRELSLRSTQSRVP